MILSSSNVVFRDTNTIINIHANNVISHFNNINFQLFMIHFISILNFQNFKFSIQNFKFSISNFKNLKYFSTFTISNHLFCTLQFVVDRNINNVENNYASKIIFNSFFNYFTSFFNYFTSFFNYFTSFQIYFKIISKLKTFVVIVIFF